MPGVRRRLDEAAIVTGTGTGTSTAYRPSGPPGRLQGTGTDPDPVTEREAAAASKRIRSWFRADLAARLTPIAKIKPKPGKRVRKGQIPSFSSAPVTRRELRPQPNRTEWNAL